jgi:hypothetical protein
MLARGWFRIAVLAGGLVSLTSQAALAQVSHSAVSGDFVDVENAMTRPEVRIDTRGSATDRALSGDVVSDGDNRRSLALSLATGGGDLPVDVSVSQHASFGADGAGDVNRTGHGSEVRVGRGLVRNDDGEDRSGSTYMFVASDNEALTWRPGARSEFGGNGDRLGIENRVEVGDLSAGVTYERDGVQASLAYVERSESTQVGTRNFSQDQSFTGVTVTVRNAP